LIGKFEIFQVKPRKVAGNKDRATQLAIKI